MTTICAVNQRGFHFKGYLLRGELTHTSIFPGVFNCVNIVNVVLFHVYPSKNKVSPILRRLWNFTEYSFAVINPELQLNSLRSHWVIRVWSLEPTILSAILPCPLSVDWTSHYFRFAKICSIVLPCLAVVLISICFHLSQLLLRILSSKSKHKSAELCSPSILYSKGKDIS